MKKGFSFQEIWRFIRNKEHDMSELKPGEHFELMIGELQRVELKPGDVFVIHCDMLLTEEAIQGMRDAWDRLMPGHKVIILDKGMRLGVVSTMFTDEKKE